MPTETQKNFRREIKKLENEIRKRHEEDIYHENYWEPKNRYKTFNFKKAGFVVISLFLLVLLIQQEMGVFTTATNSKSAEKQKVHLYVTNSNTKRAIYDYLEWFKHIQFRKVEMFENINGALKSLNSNELSKTEFLNELDNIKEYVFQIQRDVIYQKNPVEVQELHNLLMAEMEAYLYGLEHLHKGVAQNSQEDLKHYYAYFEEGREKNKKYIDEIISVIERVGIRYERHEKGVHYWIENIDKGVYL